MKSNVFIREFLSYYGLLFKKFSYYFINKVLRLLFYDWLWIIKRYKEKEIILFKIIVISYYILDFSVLFIEFFIDKW